MSEPALLRRPGLPSTPLAELFSGPRLAFGLFWLGLATAPLESLRLRGSVTIADVLLAAGMGVALISRRGGRFELPTLWLMALLIGASTAFWQFWLDPATLRKSVVQFLVIAYTHLLIPVFIAQWYRDDSRTIRALVKAWLLGAAFGAVVAILESRGLAPGVLDPFLKDRGARVAGLTYHSTTLGFNCSLALAAALVLFLESRRAVTALGWAVIVAVTLLAANLSGSRTSILAPLVGVVAVLVARMLVGLLPVITVQRLVVVFAGIVVLAGTMGAGAAQRAESAFERIIGGASSAYSDHVRQVKFERALVNIWDSPVAGNGYHLIGQAHHRLLELLEAGGVMMLLAFGLTVGFLAQLTGKALRFATVHPQRDLYWALISVYVSYWAVYWAHSGLFSRSVGVAWGLLMLVTMHMLHGERLSRAGSTQPLHRPT